MSNDPLSINVRLVPVKYRSTGPYFFFFSFFSLFPCTVWRATVEQAAVEEAQEPHSNTTSHPLIREQMEEMEGREVSHGKAAGDEWLALCWLFGGCWQPSAAAAPLWTLQSSPQSYNSDSYYSQLFFLFFVL